MCDLRVLPSVLARKAADELNEKPANTAEYLDALRNWLKHQSHIRARTTDQFLIIFLRASKFSLEKAKQKLQNYYTYRRWMPELFANRDLNEPKIYDVIRSGAVLHLPEPVGEDGPRVIILRLSAFNMDQFTILDIFRTGAMTSDILIQKDDNAIVSGYVFVMDLTNMSKSVILNFDPNFVRKVTIVANKISPVRMKGFHFLNVPTIFEKLYNLVKSVINTKLQDRFYIHNHNLDALYQYIPKRILPKEYGGEYDIDEICNCWVEKLKANKELLMEEESYGIIKGCKAPNYKQIPEDGSTTFGVDGSFRKLNFD